MHRALKIAVVSMCSSGAFAGDLAPPPGPVQATDRFTLNEQSVTLPYTITSPGSYVLTSNLTGVAGQDGIIVSALGVTIDLNGFNLIGVAGSGIGINGQGRNNIHIRNGIVRAWGADGINCTGTGIVVENVRTNNNAGDGIDVASAVVVQDCTARNNSGDGIRVTGSGTVEGCSATGSGAAGISIIEGVVRSCSSEGNLYGIEADRAMVLDCTVTRNSNAGIRLFDDSTARNNHCVLNTSVGITTLGDRCRVEGNTVRASAVGLDINFDECEITGNSVTQNADNYDISGTHKIEILLGDIPESIDWPCSVTLAGSLTGATGVDGITVNADDVTIDLNGHALNGVPGSLDGIVGAGVSRLRVRNGAIRGWGSEGVSFTPGASAFHLSDLRLDGCGSNGARVPTSSRIDSCIATTNATHGFTSIELGVSVTNSSASGNDRGFAINGGTLRDCTAEGNTSFGFVLTRCSTNGCYASTNATGFVVDGGTITACAAALNTADGFDCDKSLVTGCSARANATGFRIANGATCDQGHAVDNTVDGFVLANFGGMVMRCTARGNGLDYNLGGSNAFGPIVVVTNVGDISGVGAAAHPWANFVY